MATKTRTKQEIQAEIANLLAIEVHVESNQGTFSSAEAYRACGSGDPRHANREVYETVGGTRRATGPTEDKSPGRMRQINQKTLSDFRSQVATLRAELKSK